MRTGERQSTAETVIAELDRIAPGVPLLALGQTIFWDEPMKAGLPALVSKFGQPRRFIAGVHDTDYFAKLPIGRRQFGRFKALSHNDTTTRGLWSAAAEFSALFGSETVVTREALVHAGLRIDKLVEARPGILDEATEAWGWRGVASLDEVAPITLEVPLNAVKAELFSTLDWAIGASVACIAGESGRTAAKLAQDWIQALNSFESPGMSLADYYEAALPAVVEFVNGAPARMETSRTSRLLKFNRETARLDRFELLRLFVEPGTSARAKAAYDASIEGSGLYGLDRFGTGAIPFDLVIPGHGRGTIRLGKKGAVIATPKPLFLTFREPITVLEDFAAAVEAKFGPDCAVVGKAVALIGMLAREFVFAFHEGASSYVSRSRELHRRLAESVGWNPALNPILRIKYDAWSSMSVCCSWLNLPEPFQRAFGTEELCAPSFSQRWREVADEQRKLLAELGTLQRPVELVEFLESKVGGSWGALAAEYRGLRTDVERFSNEIARLRDERRRMVNEMRRLRAEKVAAEQEMGRHFRAQIFGRVPKASAMAERTRLARAVAGIEGAKSALEMELHQLERARRELTHSALVQHVHDRRRAIELEAELKRLRMIRGAIISSDGLERANRRPSAWWFRLVCPDGLWLRETVDSAEYYLEPLR